jgi:hypothetical protein
MPQPPAMPAFGGMPQAGGFAQPQAPSASMNYTPPAMTVPAMTMPQAPAMSVPAPPAPAPPVPQAPANKMQQMIPLLLILIAFLLVGLIVMVFFLMKH